jgi:hypothetical protein
MSTQLLSHWSRNRRTTATLLLPWTTSTSLLGSATLLLVSVNPEVERGVPGR